MKAKCTCDAEKGRTRLLSNGQGFTSYWDYLGGIEIALPGGQADERLRLMKAKA
jgi:hypothetical protein